MTVLLKQIFAFLKLLNSDTGTNQIAAGITAGFILGMSPFFSLQGIFIFILCLFLRIQLGAMFISIFFFSFIAYCFDPLFHLMGLTILQMDGALDLWTMFYNAPIIPLTRFNNTVIMGAGVTSLILSPILFIMSKVLVTKYRESIVERIKETKFFKLLKSTALFKWYYNYDKFLG